MKNSDVAHQWFYDRSGSFDRRSMTVSYYRDRYYSYSTVIGQLTENKHGQTVCIISDNNFSMTTAKHLSELRRACPFPVYYLPQERGAREFYPATVLENLQWTLEYYSKQKLTQKANRENFSRAFEMLETTLELIIFESKEEEINNLINEYQELYQQINNPETLKTIKEIQKQRDIEKQKRLKAELENYLNNYDITKLAELTYSYYSDLNKDIKAKLRSYLNPQNDLSFIWFDNDKVKTSQHITVDKKEVIALLKLWNKGKLKHGMTISYYTVLEVREDYIKVGCHKIPTTNLQALLSQLNTKQVA